MKTFYLVAALVVALDQAVKILINNSMKLYDSIPVIRGWLNITYVENSGISFGMLGAISHPAKRWILLSIVGLAMIAIFIYWFKSPKSQALFNLSCGMILGGAAGNFIDRLYIGRVVDFIEVYHKSWSFPVFNIADSAVSVGVCLFILHTLLEKPAKEENRE